MNISTLIFFGSLIGFGKAGMDMCAYMFVRARAGYVSVCLCVCRALSACVWLCVFVHMLARKYMKVSV